MSIKKLILVLVASFLCTGCVLTNDFFNSSRPKLGYTSMDWGIRYLLGYGVIANDKKAFYYFNKSAAENNVFAQNELAYLYAAGRGTKKNYQKAYAYYELAAKQGLASAQYNLAILYWYGLGTNQDKEAAFGWLKKSANQGFEPAKVFLSTTLQ